MNSCRRIIRQYSQSVKPVRKAVIVSTSNDIFTNLALEDWFYRYHDFKTDRHLLMLWTNEPCVVIGRHQNPWQECNVSKLRKIATTNGNVQLARRNSGGGTVYHDTGNLNLTFFTPKAHYDRKHNLELIRNSIVNQYGLKVDISPREDLTIREHKVSGTAAKVARLIAYHHCTVLVSANKDALHQSLHKPAGYEIKTNATKSICSKIMNISEENVKINVHDLLKSIGVRYLIANNVKFLENTPNLLNSIRLSNEQFCMENKPFEGNCIDYDTKTFHLVEPNDGNFPGLEEIRSNLAGWQWVFGKTPKFSVSKMFRLKQPSQQKRIIYTAGDSYAFLLHMDVEAGRIVNVNITAPRTYGGKNLNDKLIGENDFRGTEFSDDVIQQILNVFEEKISGTQHVEKQYVKDVSS